MDSKTKIAMHKDELPSGLRGLNHTMDSEEKNAMECNVRSIYEIL